MQGAARAQGHAAGQVGQAEGGRRIRELSPLNNNNRGNNRRRGRGNRQSGGGGGQQLNRIDSRARGNAPQLLEKYRKLAQDAHLVPIPGTKRRKYLDDNAGAMDLQLSAQELAALGQAFAPERVVGARYTPAMAAAVDRG